MSCNQRHLRIAVIGCKVLEDEIAYLAQGTTQIVCVEMLEQGLHQEPEKLRQAVQEAINRIETQDTADVIALMYGLCSRGTEGVKTQRCKLVMARAHDCITLLLGSKERYAEYAKAHPGTYWYSPGWNRHHLPPGKERFEKLYESYKEKYGEDNAEYLMRTEQSWFTTYGRATYVDIGAGATPEDVEYTRQCAAWLKWEFDRQKGDEKLMRDLLSGNWDPERFVVLEPGEEFAMTADERVVQVNMKTKPRINADEHR